MPMFVHNFTSYFHEKQRDLYFVTFSQVKKGPLGLPDVQDYEAIPGRRELLKWIKENLPETKVGPIFAYDSDSGFITTVRSFWNLRRKIKRNSKAAGRPPKEKHSMNAGSATCIRSNSTRKNTAAAFRLLKNISTETQHHDQTYRHDINTQTSGSTGTA